MREGGKRLLADMLTARKAAAAAAVAHPAIKAATPAAAAAAAPPPPPPPPLPRALRDKRRSANGRRSGSARSCSSSTSPANGKSKRSIGTDTNGNSTEALARKGSTASTASTVSAGKVGDASADGSDDESDRTVPARRHGSANGSACTALATAVHGSGKQSPTRASEREASKKEDDTEKSKVWTEAEVPTPVVVEMLERERLLTSAKLHMLQCARDENHREVRLVRRAG